MRRSASRATILILAACAGLSPVGAIPVPLQPDKRVVVRSVRVVELDGDHDGFADTGETLDLWVTVSNKTGGELTHVVAQLSTQDPRIDCISFSDSVAALLPAGESVELPVPFRLTVSAKADRAGVVPPVACIAGACSNGAGACATPGACTRTSLASPR